MKVQITYLEFEVVSEDLLLADPEEFDAEEYAAGLAAGWIGETIEIDDPEEALADWISDAEGFPVRAIRYKEV